MDLELWKKQKIELGITFDDLSQKTHISISTLKDIFRGKTYAPRIDTVQAIEKALGLSNNDLWTDEDYKSGVSMTKKVAITPLEENVLVAAKPVIALYGEKGAKLLIDFCELITKK